MFYSRSSNVSANWTNDSKTLVVSSCDGRFYVYSVNKSGRKLIQHSIDYSNYRITSYWIHTCAVSNNGQWLAWAAHDSIVHFGKIDIDNEKCLEQKKWKCHKSF